MYKNERKILRDLIKLQPNENQTVVCYTPGGYFYNEETHKRTNFRFPVAQTCGILTSLANYGYIEFDEYEFRERSSFRIYPAAYHTRELFWQSVGEFLLKSVLVPITLTIITNAVLHYFGLN